MRFVLTYIFLFVSGFSMAQGNKLRDSLQIPVHDTIMKAKLIELALKNPALQGADAMVGSAEYELKRAKTSWMNSVVLSGNVNEFVINNTSINGISASTLYPKYNIGVNIPLGMFNRQEKNISREKVKLYEAERESRKRALVKEVLIRYENLKEKIELLGLQRQITDGQYTTYQQIQKDYAAGEIQDVQEVNKEYEIWIDQRAKLRTKQKELEIAILDLEEIIGVSWNDLLKSLTTETK